MSKYSLDQLETEGWVRRSTTSGARLKEAVENYRMLGFEVRSIPVSDLDLDGCTECFDGEGEPVAMIFTRGEPSGADAFEDDTAG
jgi:hypothetical protein